MQTTDLTKESAVFLCSLETMSTDGISSQGSVTESSAMNRSAAEALRTLPQMLPSASMAGKTAAVDIGSKGTHHPEKEERRTAADIEGSGGPVHEVHGRNPWGAQGGLLQCGTERRWTYPREKGSLSVFTPRVVWFLECRSDLPSFN